MNLLSDLADSLWTPICATDIDAYDRYVQGFASCLRTFSVHGVANTCGGGVVSPVNGIGGGFVYPSECEERLGFRDCSDDASLHVIGGCAGNIGSSSVVSGDGGLHDGVHGSAFQLSGIGVDTPLPSVGESSQDKGSGEFSSEALAKKKRNFDNRVAQKARKAKRKALGQDWRKGEVKKKKEKLGFEAQADVVGGAGEDVNGFWNSCSSDTRKELIESKARMHIAENERREREARDKIQEMTSAFGMMKKVVQMAEFATKQAEKEKDNRIFGWAKTIATSSAEDLANSTPSSVPSFKELTEKLEASSQSSFELELKAKDDEIAALKSYKEQYDSAVSELDKFRAQESANLRRQVAADERSRAQRKESEDWKKKHDAVVRRIHELERKKQLGRTILSRSFNDCEIEVVR